MRFSTNQRLDTQPNTINVVFQRFPSKTKYIGFRNSPSRHIVIIPYFHFLDNTSKAKKQKENPNLLDAQRYTEKSTAV